MGARSGKRRAAGLAASSSSAADRRRQQQRRRRSTRQLGEAPDMPGGTMAWYALAPATPLMCCVPPRCAAKYLAASERNSLTRSRGRLVACRRRGQGAGSNTHRFANAGRKGGLRGTCLARSRGRPATFGRRRGVSRGAGVCTGAGRRVVAGTWGAQGRRATQSTRTWPRLGLAWPRPPASRCANCRLKLSTAEG